ncbi:TadE/TadG family type IV pilus assembly protein [Dyella tabacisoli]|uniref:Pilus assembly protein n=1 Tax=Dyella tabacisoli TaxID=2282381 RepID=A0A369ULC8_9GAMM|nr:TadE/TadG family type IV pilus assembly protein [Dyella tabacisoli]RDD81331.1 pilus assembly protein [Dyella tabacisoli]
MNTANRRHRSYVRSLARSVRRQRGVAAIEFALVFLFGMLPLLLITFSGVLIFAAKQSLTLAAAEGARAALHYGTQAQRETYACQAAQRAMQWLLTFSGETTDCTAPPAPGGTYAPITVSVETACPSTPTLQCMTVQTSFDYDNHPFIPGTAVVYGWLLHETLSSSATVQLDLVGN